MSTAEPTRYNGPFPRSAHGCEAHWRPVRTVRFAQKCQWCLADIPKTKPGNTTGTRGTKAWFNQMINAWECLDCRSEGVRVEIERARIDDESRRRGGIH